MIFFLIQIHSSKFCSLICMAIIQVYVHKMMEVVQQWTCCSSEFLLKNACILQLILSCYSIYKIYQKSSSVLTQIQKQTRKLFIKCMKLSALNKNLNGTIQFTTNSLFFWYADMIWLLYCQKVVIYMYLSKWLDGSCSYVEPASTCI